MVVLSCVCYGRYHFTVYNSLLYLFQINSDRNILRLSSLHTASCLKFSLSHYHQLVIYKYEIHIADGQRMISLFNDKACLHLCVIGNDLNCCSFVFMCRQLRVVYDELAVRCHVGRLPQDKAVPLL